MSGIVPSQVVAYIDQAFPNLQSQNDFMVTYSDAGFVRGLEALLERVDPILLPTVGDDAVLLLTCRAKMMSHVRMWETQGNTANMQGLRGKIRENVIAVVRRVLSKCPDEPIPKSAKGFEFIKDKDLRAEFLRDLGSVEFQIRHGQWKASMVLAGGLIEAVLCNQIEGANAKKCASAIQGLKGLHADITHWYLGQYVEVAHRLGLIREKTKELALLGGELRNLIHPGRAIREKMECSRATALVVLAALTSILEDLGR